MSVTAMTCERRACEVEAAPDSRYCPKHQQEMVLGLEECRAVDCDERVPFGSLWCALHAKARADGRMSANGQALDAPTDSRCRMPACPSPALAGTVGKRAAGGWNDLCQKHLDEKKAKHAASLAVARSVKAGNGAMPPPPDHPPVADPKPPPPPQPAAPIPSALAKHEIEAVRDLLERVEWGGSLPAPASAWASALTAVYETISTELYEGRFANIDGLRIVAAALIAQADSLRAAITRLDSE